LKAFALARICEGRTFKARDRKKSEKLDNEKEEE